MHHHVLVLLLIPEIIDPTGPHAIAFACNALRPFGFRPDTSRPTLCRYPSEEEMREANETCWILEITGYVPDPWCINDLPHIVDVRIDPLPAIRADQDTDLDEAEEEDSFPPAASDHWLIPSLIAIAWGLWQFASWPRRWRRSWWCAHITSRSYFQRPT